VGGGPVGACAALALAANGIDVTLLEARDAQVAAADPRTLALSHGSRMILERLHCWPLIESVRRSRPFTSRSARDSAARCCRHGKLGVPALGYVVGYAVLARALDQALNVRGVRRLSGARVVSLLAGRESASAPIRAGRVMRTLSAQLLAVADGARRHRGGRGRRTRLSAMRSAGAGACRSAAAHSGLRALHRRRPLALLPRRQPLRSSGLPRGARAGTVRNAGRAVCAAFARKFRRSTGPVHRGGHARKLAAAAALHYADCR